MTARSKQRGSAMLVTMIIISSLLAGAAVLVSMQLASNKSNDFERNGLAALYCAEAGGVAAQATVASNYAAWNTSLCSGTALQNDTCTQPTWLNDTAFSHDLDGDGVDDFQIFLKDDDDETTVNDPTVDINNKIFIVSKCTKYPDTPKEVEILISYTPTAQCYQSQGGGCNGRGNNN
jgi:type II secretory pathway pseudopilin PulG